jgi:hypothetical protein
MPKPPPLVTLLTDFGTRDPYVAAMKGALLRNCPEARIVDLSHDVPPHDILAAAVVLWQAAPQFPTGTLHVVVVDPTVGTERRILAGQFGSHLFLVPDNGVITLIEQTMPAEALHVVRNTQYLPREASMTFQGRDLFAPVAGHILHGVPLNRLGPPPDAYTLLDIPVPKQAGDALVGQVIYIDRFGNLVSNISRDLLTELGWELDRLRVVCGNRDVGTLQGAYGFVKPGEALALINSMDLVEIAVNRESASDGLNARIGAEVRILPA